MSSSTSGRMGSGMHPGHVPPGHRWPCPPGVIPRFLSTGPPHSAQWDSSASTRALSCRLRCPLALWERVAMPHPRGCLGGLFLRYDGPCGVFHDEPVDAVYGVACEECGECLCRAFSEVVPVVCVGRDLECDVSV